MHIAFFKLSFVFVSADDVQFVGIQVLPIILSSGTVINNEGRKVRATVFDALNGFVEVKPVEYSSIFISHDLMNGCYFSISMHKLHYPSLLSILSSASYFHLKTSPNFTYRIPLLFSQELDICCFGGKTHFFPSEVLIVSDHLRQI